MKTLKEYLYNEDGSKKQVSFVEYRKGNLWYTVDDIVFPVDINDIGDATFKNVDVAPLFMRYIRKYLESLANASK